jgi:2-isopropylmalate synthase
VAVLGANIFATEAGVHQDGLIKDPDTYLPFRPEMVGAPGIRLVLGPHSGRAAFSQGLAKLDISLPDDELERLIDWAKKQPKDAFAREKNLLRQGIEFLKTSA